MPDVPRRLQKKLLAWVASTRDLREALLASDLIVNASDQPLPAPDVVERSHLLAGAQIEVVHAMLVTVGVLLPGHLEEADLVTTRARRAQHPEVGRG